MAQDALGSLGIGGFPPFFDCDPRFCRTVDDLATELLILKLHFEALAISVIRWPSGLDVGPLGSERCNTFSRVCGHEVQALIAQSMICTPR